MNSKMNLLCAFYVVTSKGDWGRGLELDAAIKSAHLDRINNKKVKYLVTVFLFKAGTSDAIRQNIINCYYPDMTGNLKRAVDLNDDDDQQIEEYLVGWTTFNNEHLFLKQGKDGKKKGKG